MDYEQEKSKQRSSMKMKTTIIVLGVLLFIMGGVFIYVKKLMPEHLFNQGKKYMEIGQYDKALNMFNIAAGRKPYDSEPIYYQALALSKLEPTYENQRKLYEISQLEDVDDASMLAERILDDMRKQIEREAGSNYIDNILFDDVLIRWNNSTPITYSVLGDISVPQEYYDTVKEAFERWQTATNGQIMLRQTDESRSADIVVNFIDDISKFDGLTTGKTVPEIDNDVLKKMNIYIRKTNNRGEFYDTNKLMTLLEHEIGHALGLGAHSASPDDIMYFENEKIDENTFEKNITQRDLNTLNLLYKMVPDIIDVPISEEESRNMFYHVFLTTYPGENFEIEIQRLISELANDRKNIVKWVDLAINYAIKKQYERSNSILKSVLPLVSNDFQNQFVILYNLAANYYKMKDYKTAFSYLSLAENIQSDMETNILNAFIDVREDRIDLAEEKLKLLIKSYPDNIDIALKLAEVYYIKQDKKAEKKVIDDFVKKNPKALRDRRILKYKANKKTSS